MKLSCTLKGQEGKNFYRSIITFLPPSLPSFHMRKALIKKKFLLNLFNMASTAAEKKK